MKKTKRRGNALQETWQPVTGYQGLYEVSDRGRVRSLHGHSRQSGHVLRPSLMGGGGSIGKYPGVSLSRKGKRRPALIHTLVAKAFLGRRPKGHEIDHVNGDREDNRAANLEYVTKAVNYERAKQLGLLHKARGEAHGNAAINETTVRRIRRLKRNGWTQRRIAQHLSLSEFHVSKICRGKLWAHVK